ncbi:MAG: RNA methyltransferase [Treponema sp.]|nr:RNA methyltransferase [Treponema sp.]
MNLNDVVIILSRPAEAGNVGAVCRAMKNMGLSRLRLVAPEFSVDVPSADDTSAGGIMTEAGFEYGGNLAVIRARAIHAADVWEKAETFGSLQEAVRDFSLVIGTTRRRGRRRKHVSMTPAETAALLADSQGQAAIVFGNERTGLEDEELEICNMASHIPADDLFPSLNLSHAVMVYAYELYLAMAGAEKFSAKGQWVPMDQENINLHVKRLTDRLKDLGFYKKPGREEQERFYRDLFARAGLTEREAEYLIDNMAKAARLSLC